MEVTQKPSSMTSSCAICGGSGELVAIDDDVGCQVTVPCWSCQPPPPIKPTAAD